MQQNINQVAERDSHINFDILRAFQSLEATRQMVVCDTLFHERGSAFKRTVNMLFPHACSHDATRLEAFLRLRLKR